MNIDVVPCSCIAPKNLLSACSIYLGTQIADLVTDMAPRISQTPYLACDLEISISVSHHELTILLVVACSVEYGMNARRVETQRAIRNGSV